MLTPTKWDVLNCTERLNVLQVIANIESTYLGLPHELYVFSETMDEQQLGYYNDRTHSIYVNLDYLTYGDSKEVLNTLLHEAFHAYERRLVDLYNHTDPHEKNLIFLRRASKYNTEFQNYIHGNEDILGYSQQSIEQDSDNYANTATEYYLYIAERASGNNTRG